MRKEDHFPLYVDGVVKLHTQLHEAFLQASKLANTVLGIPLPSKDSLRGFSIYVDFSEPHPENKFKGYFMSKNIILRFLPIEFDYALLFPIRNHGDGLFREGKGITYDEIIQAANKRQPLKIIFRPISAIEDNIFYSPHFSLKSTFAPAGIAAISDDFGNIVYNFPDIDCLKVIDIPETYIERDYTLVGKQFYAPYTTNKESDCVLFAQLNNEHDDHAIKVLRWVPSKKGVEIEQILGMKPDGGDVFFEMGYISRTENTELHAFMVNNKSRLLFGKKVDDKITIVGGVKIFESNDLKYPKCLYNIDLK